MRIAILGGAGSLGRELCKQLLGCNPDDRIVIYSRDEGKHADMRKTIPEGGPRGTRYMLGDICDTDRLRMAIRNCEMVYHCAAMKMIDTCEYDAMEAERINIEGTKSVIRACIAENVLRAVHIGTDKIPDAVSIYGLSKAMAEGLWTHANTYGACEFVGVRYGNVCGSNKSVFHAWRNADVIHLTDANATRFFWPVSQAAEFVRHVMVDHSGTRGEVYIPKMQSYRMVDIASQYGKPIRIIGWRCPEKTHEVLWTDFETQNVRDQGDHYCLYPYTHPWGKIDIKGEEVISPISSMDYTTPLPEYLR